MQTYRFSGESSEPFEYKVEVLAFDGAPTRYLRELVSSLHIDQDAVDRAKKAYKEASGAEREVLAKEAYFNQFLLDLDRMSVEVNGKMFNNGVPVDRTKENAEKRKALLKIFPVRKEIVVLQQGRSANVQCFIRDNFSFEGYSDFMPIDSLKKQKLFRKGSLYGYEVALPVYYVMDEKGDYWAQKNGKPIKILSEKLDEFSPEDGYEPLMSYTLTCQVDLKVFPTKVSVVVEMQVHPKIEYKGSAISDDLIEIQLPKKKSRFKWRMENTESVKKKEELFAFQAVLDKTESDLRKQHSRDDLSIDRFSYDNKQGITVEIPKQDGSSELVEHSLSQEKELETLLSPDPSYKAIAILFEINKRFFPLRMDACGEDEVLLKVYMAAQFSGKEVKFAPSDRERLEAHPEYKVLKSLKDGAWISRLSDRGELEELKRCFPQAEFKKDLAFISGTKRKPLPEEPSVLESPRKKR